VRGWRPGDRIRSGAGTRKLKRVFADRKVGRSERSGYPLVADAGGILWVVGLMQGTRAAAAEGEVLSFWFERDE
jgi:tRNA(Ile)-lysidine synthetase-like protein